MELAYRTFHFWRFPGPGGAEESDVIHPRWNQQRLSSPTQPGWNQLLNIKVISPKLLSCAAQEDHQWGLLGV